MSIFRKIFLTLAIALVVFCYGYPMFVLPFGDYKYSYKAGDQTKSVSVNFKFDGSYVTKDGDAEVTGYYKVKKGKLYLADTKEALKEVEESEGITISNMYEFGYEFGSLGSVKFENTVGKYTMIGVGVVSLLLVLSIPDRRRD